MFELVVREGKGKIGMGIEEQDSYFLSTYFPSKS